MGILSTTALRKVGVITLGCRVNQYESEALTEALASLGYVPAQFSDSCDLYVINTCAVTEESVRKSRQMVRRAAKKNPHAILAVCGCASQLEAERFAAMPGVLFVCGTRNKEALIEAVAAHLRGDALCSPQIVTPCGPLAPTAITHFDRTRAYVKIQDGCNGHCSYCIIPSLRGEIVLRDRNEILREVTTLAQGGCHEIVLTGIETAAYGKGLPTLVRDIAEIPGIHRIRLGSMEPSFLKPDIIDALTSVTAFCPHFHVSVQNGSDRILRAMRRKYSVAMLEQNLAYIRSVMPDCQFSADIIVGFPGETEGDFENTCDLVRRIGFLHLHIFPYSKRPGTEAASLPQTVPEDTKADRLRRLSAIAAEQKHAFLTELIAKNRPLPVLVETVSEGCLIGHSDTFVECRIECPTSRSALPLRGQIVTMRPTHTDGSVLFGTLIACHNT
ncbi:MAG: tRNA (N(6)-L-threonylcarbamoyladenosine(37)-C(2))-methylthiotransferase MtaB [Ruminococcaceae bacterium]|nr:tRNA (N(6)-L-threonylcarbamoyladenosine(37)-C(2))-methylthiotransferase MtaB [Oscillospiraceae bacterium]